METTQVTPEEFEAHIAAGTLRLAFVGMSNGGKSYRSRVLRDEEFFLWYQVDEEIQKSLGFADMAEISSWLGYPESEHYLEREQEYLRLENESTAHASMHTGGKNLVFDTTGSVAHLTQETLAVLRGNCLVVHLDIGSDSVAHMIEQFFESPKPVAWCGYFTKQEGEDAQEALRHSYPTLLVERLKTYRAIAHVNIPTSDLRDKTGAETLEIIKQHLGA